MKVHIHATAALPSECRYVGSGEDDPSVSASLVHAGLFITGWSDSYLLVTNRAFPSGYPAGGTGWMNVIFLTHSFDNSIYNVFLWSIGIMVTYMSVLRKESS
ncbi:hypothetical protein [Methanogenium organophilum]|uniref:Uncharacterized protein n=1 Tax=Methanogenium organophilum TaxID=2199 RepID=A0A9X9S6V0_METOG|nr:hypothetical protein [Methanogenium organophilum]WAI02512.1 hypothetical protein OU421_06450 [Methanogenium organophilum]